MSILLYAPESKSEFLWISCFWGDLLNDSRSYTMMEKSLKTLLDKEASRQRVSSLTSQILFLPHRILVAQRKLIYSGFADTFCFIKSGWFHDKRPPQKWQSPRSEIEAFLTHLVVVRFGRSPASELSLQLWMVVVYVCVSVQRYGARMLSSRNPTLLVERPWAISR
jgi:hypothetical protein